MSVSQWHASDGNYEGLNDHNVLLLVVPVNHLSLSSRPHLHLTAVPSLTQQHLVTMDYRY